MVNFILTVLCRISNNWRRGEKFMLGVWRIYLKLGQEGSKILCVCGHCQYPRDSSLRIFIESYFIPTPFCQLLKAS